MNTLKLGPALYSKLDRLKEKADSLQYLGTDPNSLKGAPFVAVVGTRKPTPYGKLMTEKLVEGLARAGVVIVSGLALGIDALAHDAALRSGGTTIAVLPSGLETIYPATNRPLADAIIKNGGSLVSEYPAGHKPKKIEFLERNRLIAAFSDAVLIPEAAANSGSLNTANHGRTMLIPVCAVPGNVTSPMSEGTNYLLKQGATPVTEAEDVLRLLGITSKHTQLTLNLTGDTPAETIVLQKIASGISEPSSLQAETELSTGEFQIAMSMLEVQGRITCDELGSWRLT